MAAAPATPDTLPLHPIQQILINHAPSESRERITFVPSSFLFFQWRGREIWDLWQKGNGNDSPNDDGCDGRALSRVKERRHVDPGPRVERGVGDEKGESLVGPQFLVGGSIRGERHLPQGSDGLYLNPGLASAVALGPGLEDRVGDLHEPGEALRDLDSARGVGGRQGRPPRRGDGDLGEADSVLAVGAAGGGQGRPSREGGVQNDADPLVPGEQELPASPGLATGVEEHPQDRRVPRDSGPHQVRGHVEVPRGELLRVEERRRRGQVPARLGTRERVQRVRDYVPRRDRLLRAERSVRRSHRGWLARLENRERVDREDRTRRGWTRSQDRRRRDRLDLRRVRLARRVLQEETSVLVLEVDLDRRGHTCEQKNTCVNLIFYFPRSPVSLRSRPRTYVGSDRFPRYFFPSFFLPPDDLYVSTMIITLYSIKK